MSEMIPKAAAQSELVAKLRALAETHSIGKCDHATHQDDGICGDCDDQAAATMREAADALLASASVSPQEEASAVPPTNTIAEIEAELASCQNIGQPCYYCLGLRKKLAALQAASVSPPAPTWRPIESEDLAAKMRTLSRTARKRASFRAGPEAWAAKAEANLICDELDALSASTSMPVVQSLLDAIIAADAAINPPDRGGISMQNWDARLKAATTIIRAAKETAWKALGIWKPANPPPSSPSPAETGEK